MAATIPMSAIPPNPTTTAMTRPEPVGVVEAAAMSKRCRLFEVARG